MTCDSQKISTSNRSPCCKSIPSQFTYDGFVFRLVKRVGDVALFEKSKPTHSRPSYEVVLVQHHPAKNIMGREYPDREAMPPSEAWGTHGWTYTELEDAKRKFRALVEQRQEADFQRTPFPAGALFDTGSSRTANRRP